MTRSPAPSQVPRPGPDVYARLATVDALWIDLMATVGARVVRDRSCFVAYDGEGKLRLAPDADLDPDDSIAALLLHELCHLAVVGERAIHTVDWGLPYVDSGGDPGSSGLAEEYAALRMQYALAASVGLADALHPTTEHRRYYDALRDQQPSSEQQLDATFQPADALSIRKAEAGMRWLREQPWCNQLVGALAATNNAFRGGLLVPTDVRRGERLPDCRDCGLQVAQPHHFGAKR